ncbi:MAG: ABC transporter permease [Methanobrevibacter sp.]|nr:ABC transporter permease [Methanobrevibacter sp.]
MKFISLILKNPFRNKTRSALSIIGIAIGIATIVALGLITTGMENSVQSTFNDVGAEITVSNSTMVGGSSALLDESLIEDLKNVSGVIDATGTLSVTDTSEFSGSMEEGPSSMGMVSINGLYPDKLNLMSIDDIDGSAYENNSYEAIVGAQYAEMNNVSVGDNITLLGKDFKVTGIFEIGLIFVDSRIYVPLDTLQNLSGVDGVSSILVKTGEAVNDSAISEEIKDSYNVTTLTSEEMSSMADSVLGILDAVSLAVSALAIVVGAIGVVNTMVMSVYERTKEIGVLKSVGWKSRRILLMILGETLVLTIISGIIGSVFGILVSEIGVRLIGMENFSLGYDPRTFILAFGITIIVGIIGGLYPAYKASKLAPTEALRYE